MAHTKVTKTHSQNTGAANTFSYSGSFDVFKGSEVVVLLDGIALTLQAGTIDESASPREYTVDTTAKTIHIGGADLSSGTITIRPETDLGNPTPRATYAPGASVTSDDLNNNQLQLMRKAMEYNEQKLASTGGTMTGDLHLGQNVNLTFEGSAEDAHETTLTVANPTSDKTITLPDTTGTVVTTGDTGTVATAMIAGDAVNGTKIADDAINSEHIADGSVDLVHLSSNSVNSSKIVNGSIVADDLASDAVTTVKIIDDAVTADKLANTSVTAGSYTATDLTVDDQGRITAAASGTIAGSEIAADAIDGTKIADDSINSEHYVDGSIDHAHLSNDCIDGDNIQDDVINSEHYAADSIDTEHYAPTSIDSAALASNAVTESKITDSNVTTNKIANDAVTIGKIGCEQTTISNSDSHLPTSGAVVDYVAAQIAPIGGLEVIADEDNFPTSQPSSGVVISISDAAGIVVNGSGVSTTARTAGNGSDNVTINNFPSSLNGETLASGVGLMVSSTGSSNTYNYHKILAAETDVKQLSDDINDFNARYRVNAGEPGSNNDEGDLVYDTNADKMKVYDSTTSAWKEVTSTGDFKYLFLCPAGGSGAPTINGSIATYDLRESSNSGSAASVTNAAQLIVSINGVVQKANTGTSAPAEGFALVDANTIIFGANLASGDSVFIIQIGSAVTIPTPGDGTVSAAKIASGAVTTAKLADDAVTDAKIANSINTAIAANTAKTSNATHTGDVTGSTSLTIAADAVTTAKIADDAVTADKLANSINTAIAANTAKDLTALSASNLTSGTIPDARLPATLPAISGANLTNLPASGTPSNLVINGAMTLSQRSTLSTVSGMKTIDRFTCNWSGGGVTQEQKSEQSGTVFENGFSNYLRLTNTSNTSTDTDYRFIGTTLEAQDISNSGWNFKSASSYVTLSFWVRSSLAGTYYGWLNSRDGTAKTHTFSFTVSANTWTKVTKTISGNSGVEIHDNDEEGLIVHVIPWYGTYYTTSGHTLNAWQTSSSTDRTPDFAQNWANTSNATFDLTGVQLEVGNSASGFAFESYNETLQKCKRYCHVISHAGYSLLGIGMQYYSGYIFIDGGPIDMHSTPTMVAKSGVSGAYVYEKLFSNSAQYIHQIALDGKTTRKHVVFNMSGDASRAGQAVRCSAHFASLSNNEPFVYLTAEI